MKANKNIINEAMRVEEDCKVSSKRHFNNSQYWEGIHYWLGIPSVGFAAIAGASGLSDWEYGAAIAGALSIVVAVLTAMNTFINPAQKAENHHTSGNAYLALRNKARRFYEIEASNISDQEALLSSLVELTDARDQLNATSPHTLRKSFDLARKGIDDGEAEYEIDK